jgi:hypothetical protein
MPLAERFTQSTSLQDQGLRVAEAAAFLSAGFHRKPIGGELQRMLIVSGMTPCPVSEGFTSTSTMDLSRCSRTRPAGAAHSWRA